MLLLDEFSDIVCHNLIIKFIAVRRSAVVASIRHKRKKVLAKNISN
jgi:hypothetical protein